MNENIKKFLEKVEKSPELQAKFSKIRDPEEAYKLASTIQDGFTKDEFISEMKKLYEATIADLSEEDIAKVAGGLSEDAKNILSSLGVSAATAVLVTIHVGEAMASGAAV